MWEFIVRFKFWKDKQIANGIVGITCFIDRHEWEMWVRVKRL
jgi:hypothetical protein